MERPEDFEEREEAPAEANADIAETVGDDQDPSREDRHAGGHVPEAVSGAEDQPDI